MRLYVGLIVATGIVVSIAGSSEVAAQVAAPSILDVYSGFQYRVTERGVVFEPPKDGAPVDMVECGYIEAVKRMAASGNNTFDDRAEQWMQLAAVWQLETYAAQGQAVDGALRQRASNDIAAILKKTRADVSNIGANPATAPDLRRKYELKQPLCETLAKKLDRHYLLANAGVVFNRLDPRAQTVSTDALYKWLMNMTTAYPRIEDSPGGLQLAHLLVRREPSARMYEARGYAYSQQSRLQRTDAELGIADFEKAAQLDPKNANALASKAWLENYYTLDGPAARNDLDRALEREPNLVDALYLRAHLAVEAGDLAGAIALSQRMSRMDGRQAKRHPFLNFDSVVWYLEPALLYASGDFEGAKRLAHNRDPSGLTALVGIMAWFHAENFRSRVGDLAARPTIQEACTGTQSAEPECQLFLQTVEPAQVEADARRDKNARRFLALGEFSLANGDPAAATRHLQEAVANRRSIQSPFQNVPVVLAEQELRRLASAPQAAPGEARQMPRIDAAGLGGGQWSATDVASAFEALNGDCGQRRAAACDTLEKLWACIVRADQCPFAGVPEAERAALREQVSDTGLLQIRARCRTYPNLPLGRQSCATVKHQLAETLWGENQRDRFASLSPATLESTALWSIEYCDADTTGCDLFIRLVAAKARQGSAFSPELLNAAKKYKQTGLYSVQKGACKYSKDTCAAVAGLDKVARMNP